MSGGEIHALVTMQVISIHGTGVAENMLPRCRSLMDFRGLRKARLFGTTALAQAVVIAVRPVPKWVQRFSMGHRQVARRPSAARDAVSSAVGMQRAASTSSRRCSRRVRGLLKAGSFGVSLPVAFSTLTANDYFRGELLGSLVRDVLDALKLSKFDIKSANLVEDPHRTVSVTPYAVLPSSLFEIVFYMAQERDVDAVESNLRELFSVPFSWKQGWDVVKAVLPQRTMPSVPNYLCGVFADFIGEPRFTHLRLRMLLLPLVQ